MKKTKALFLDRDGIIVEPIATEAPQTADQLKLIPQAVTVIQEAKKLGFINIVVSNQPDIALGLINEKTKRRIENKFKKLLKDMYALPEAIYYCHHDDKGSVAKYAKICNCRKPKPGMLLKAIKKFNIDIKKSFMLGDRASDIKAGSLAGVKTILFDPQDYQQKYLFENKVYPDYQVKSLEEVIPIICKQ